MIGLEYTRFYLRMELMFLCSHPTSHRLPSHYYIIIIASIALSDGMYY
jgi:hypothetical protein